MKKNKPVSLKKLVIAMLVAYSATNTTAYKVFSNTNNRDCLLLKYNKTRTFDFENNSFLCSIIDFNQYYLSDNDFLANAKPITLPYIETLSKEMIINATTEFNEVIIPNGHEHSIWYELTLTEETTVRYLVTAESYIDNGDPSISFYSGNSHPLTPVYQRDLDDFNTYHEFDKVTLPAGIYKVALTCRPSALPEYRTKLYLYTHEGPAPDKCLEFDGIDDYVKINMNRWNGGVFQSNEFSIELWVNPKSINQKRGLIGNELIGIGRTPTLWQDGANLSFDIRHQNNPTSGSSGTIPNVFDEVERWVHISWVKEGTSMYFYKNGQLIHSENTNITNFYIPPDYQTEIQLLIGASSINEDKFYGQLDDIRIWSSPLSESQIRTDMYSEINRTYYNLTAYYNFNDTIITLLRDQSSINNHGILVNMNGTEWIESYALVSPELKEATDITAYGFTANWTPPITGSYDAYKIDIATDEEFKSILVSRQDVSGAESYEATGLNPNTEYYYRVNSYLNHLGDNGAWHYSSPVKVKTIEINLAPEITSNDEISIPENQTDVRTITSNDPNEGDIVTYSITGGADQTLFTIDASTGALSFITAPDFENPTDSDGDNIYLVEITASDPEGLTDNQILSVNITDVDENMAPLITSDNIVAVEENQTYAHTITATDEDENLTFSISGGEDATLFTIDESTGAITFNLPPNYEIPSDEDGNNAYVIEIIVSDGRKTSEIQTLTIHVTDVAENAPTLEANDLVTPNGDGKNDFWVIENNHELIGYELIILNNIGETIFKTHSYDNTWDGKYNGKKVPNGTYYFLFVKGASVIKGFITLVN